MEDKLRQLIEASENILITSHISPDPDAVSSVILLNESLRLNYPQKKITAVLEERPEDLDFIAEIQNIVFQPVLELLESTKPELFILLDGNNYERCSRHDGDKIRELIADRGIRTVIIDHHEQFGKDDVDVFINNDSPATAQDIFEVCFDKLGLTKPDGAAQIAMLGFYADTGGFVYVKNGNQKRLFNFAERLVSDGADIESIKNNLERYSKEDMRVLAELIKNINQKDTYTYSLLGDDFIETWSAEGRNHLSLQRPTNTFLNNYIRNIGGRSWGFIVYKNLAQGEHTYSASFRSQGGIPDVSAIAVKLGGGGHKPAAGAKFEANNVQEALEKVHKVISEF